MTDALSLDVLDVGFFRCRGGGWHTRTTSSFEFLAQPFPFPPSPSFPLPFSPILFPDKSYFSNPPGFDFFLEAVV